MEKRTRKEAKWKQRTRRDRSLRSRVRHFAHGAAQGGARTCRSATDSVHCRLSWKDKFPQFRVFRNCGRWHAKCSKPTRWSMSLSWWGSFFPPFIRKTLMESPRERCEEPDCMCGENWNVWTSNWAQTPINVVSSPPRSFLLYFVVTSLLKKSFPLFHFFPPYSKKKLMFYFALLKMFPLILRVF